jgi:hypothetical protein
MPRLIIGITRSSNLPCNIGVGMTTAGPGPHLNTLSFGHEDRPGALDADKWSCGETPQIGVDFRQRPAANLARRPRMAVSGESNTVRPMSSCCLILDWIASDRREFECWRKSGTRKGKGEGFYSGHLRPTQGITRGTCAGFEVRTACIASGIEGLIFVRGPSPREPVLSSVSTRICFSPTRGPGAISRPFFSHVLCGLLDRCSFRRP